MAPSGPKRKRPERQDSNSEHTGRPSPHRPHNLPLAQQSPQQQSFQHNNGGYARGSRRPSRGRGGSSAPPSPSVAHPSPSAMPPPASVPAQARPQPAAPSTLPNTNGQPVTRPDPSKALASNQYITQERAAAWTTARQSVIEPAVTAQAEGDLLTLSLIFEEVVQSCIDNVVAADQLGAAVRDILAAPASDVLNPASMFLDVVSTLLSDQKTPPPSIKVLLEATNIDPQLMRSVLENEALAGLDLVRPTFAKMAIRKATHALYRQSNYNLLREETEGYSKLITEYFTTVNSEPPTEEVVSATFLRVKALVGAFDLDVGRVLDVTLDVFANLLVKHNRFFIRLLRLSSWWPEEKIPHGIEWVEPEVFALPRWALPGRSHWTYSDEEKQEQLRLREQRDIKFWHQVNGATRRGEWIYPWLELGSRRILKSPLGFGKAAADASRKSGEPSEFEKIQAWTEEWMVKTKTLPPSGNRIAAQLLGFKLRFYASDARDANDTLPDNLIYLAALLIKIGFISLADLYPHLYPLDEDMAAHQEKLEAAKREADSKKGISAKENALTRAKPLPDEDEAAPASVSRLRDSESKASSKPDSGRGSPTPKPGEGAQDSFEPVDQKVALVRSLLCIGAIADAFFILGRFPWMLNVYPDLHLYINRLAHHSLSKVNEWARPHSVEQFPAVSKGSDGTIQSQTAPRPSDYPARRTLRWAKLEERDAGDGTDYRFYWDDWADNVPICQTVDDVFGLCKSLLTFAGLEIGKDAELLTKLARIGRKSLREDASPENFERWNNLLHTTLVPALTFSGQNPPVVNEVWELLQHFDTATRYSIYALWPFTEKQQSAVAIKFAEVAKETRQIFGRVTKDNTRSMGRLIAKQAYACPDLVFQLAFKRAVGYQNMIDPLVECCRYLTTLGYDVMNWTFIKNFSSPEYKDKQADGMLAKPQLRNAALFISKAYKRHSLMDPTPVLQFVSSRLIASDLFVLDLLEQMITSMAGIGPVLALTESQVYGLSAGPLLRAFTAEMYLGDKRQACKTTGQRLLKCLKDANLAAPILIGIAQEFERFPYRPDVEEGKTPLKVVGNSMDNLYSNFAQYLDFLHSSLEEEFEDIVPGIIELLSDFGLSPSVAFTICRPSLSARANAARVERKKFADQAKKAPSPKEVNGDTVMGDGDPPSTRDADVDEVSDVDMKDAQDDDKSTIVSTTTSIATTANVQVDALVKQLKAAMPGTYEAHICLRFFVTFWQLSLADVFTVTPMKEMNEYSSASKHFADKASKVNQDRRDVSAQAVARRRNEIQIYNSKGAAIRNENKGIFEHAMKMREHLRAEMVHWFDDIPMVDARSDELHNIILQDCFLPRIMLSPQDAHFAFAMLKTMHEIGAPGFRTMKILDQLFKQRILANVIFMCTSREARNLGRFLNDLLKELGLWHSKQIHFTKSAYGPKKNLPGFGRTFNADRSPATFLDYEDFRRVMYKWHTQLFRALETCFKSDEYMHIRNAINVLKAIAPSFPSVDQMGKTLYQTVQDLSRNDPREDLKLAALSLLGDLKKNERRWTSPQKFHHSRNAQVATGATSTASRSTSEQAKTPQPSETGLNASAPNFNPRPDNVTEAVPPATNGTKDAEDGEVGDEHKRTDSDVEMRDDEIQSRRPLPAQSDSRPPAAAYREDLNWNKPAGPSHSIPSVPRPDSRAHTGPLGRPTHPLPARPDQQPPRSRLSERGADRPNDMNFQSRNETRNNVVPDYGRLDRGNEQRESFGERRGVSPGRRPQGRTPDRHEQGWEGREPREYQDDRGMRPPPRDLRGPPPSFAPREARDNMRDSRMPPRDVRDSRDRGHPITPAVDSRARLHSSAPTTPDEGGRYRRDYQPASHQVPDRGATFPSRHPPSNLSSPAFDRPPSSRDGPPVNPERAALIQDDNGRPESLRLDRDSRHDRGSRTQSPRRAHEREPAAPYPSRIESFREVRDERPDRSTHEQTPDYPQPPRERRDETGMTPTGPRGGRNDGHQTGRVSREMFNPPSRPSIHQAQDPNYGRLNPPTETAPPSGPRSYDTDRRDTVRDQPYPSASANMAPSAPVAVPPVQTNVHPSRLSNIGGPPPQTNNTIPSGPRGPARTPLGPAGSSPISARGPPTGPAANMDRNPRPQPPSTLRAINSVLSGNQGGGEIIDRNGPPPPIRGRGGNRAGAYDANMPGPMSSLHPDTPTGPRPEETFRNDRPDGRLDDGFRGHRDDRRSERAGRGRSRSPERADRRPDERSTRSGNGERPHRSEEQDRGSHRDRGPGREKSRTDRDGTRRERERDGEHSTRERRERTGREESRGHGRGEYPGVRRGPPLGPGEYPQWQGEGRGAVDARFRPGAGRDDRSDRHRDDPRDGRKRGPTNEEPPPPVNHRDKRTRH